MPSRADNQHNLVATAMRLFRRKGYAAVGLQEILTESRAPKGSLYYYFPGGKQELGEAAVTLAGEMIAQMLEELAGRHRSAKSFLKAYCEQMAAWMEESDYRSGCPIATTVLETVPDSEPIRLAAAAAMARWTSIIADVLQRIGGTRARAERDARTVIAAMEGALILARIQRSSAPIHNVARYAPGGSRRAPASD